MAHHDLKLLSRHEAPKRDGRKLWEFRSTADRYFQVGDTVTFHVVTESKRRKTGRTIGPVTITYILDVANSDDMLPDFTCIFSHTAA